VPPSDPNALPKDVNILRKIIVDLCAQLQQESTEKDKYRTLSRELLEAERGRKSEQLSKKQLALFEELWKAGEEAQGEEEPEPDAEPEQDKPQQSQARKRSGRPMWSQLPRWLSNRC